MLDLENVTNLWYHKAEYLLAEVHGENSTDGEEVKDKAEARSHKADVSRKLLELADLLGLMESIVRNEYWYYKGRGVDIEIGVFDD